MKHYLDYNATAPIRPEVLERMTELLASPLNPSSVHSFGRKAKDIVDNARQKIAEIIGVFPSEVIFTASGTEANNWVMRLFSDRRMFVSAIEHPSILKTAGIVSSSSVTIPVSENGMVNLEELDFLLGGERNFILSVMLANNETGVIQPIREIADMVHKREGLLHCDAVQSFGKIPVDFNHLDCDLMTLSAHKMGGPVGTAALIAKNNIHLYPLLTGGGQEANRRAGTENVAAIAGFARAAELIDYEYMKKIRIWLDMLEKELTTVGSRVIGKDSPRLPNTTCITMPGVPAETQLISFDLEGVAVSAGSACSSGRIETSHVLTAMGVPKEEIFTAIRISGGWATRQDDIVAMAEAWRRLLRRKNEAAA